MNETFISERITELRLARNVSEYQMSLELGQSKGYIQGITSGKCLPSAKQLFNIADYFHLTVAEFFDDGKHDSPVVLEAIQTLRQLSDDDAALILELLQRIAQPDAMAAAAGFSGHRQGASKYRRAVNGRGDVL